MRIFGGHDYYDGAAAVWHDDLVWQRGDGVPTPEQTSLLESLPQTRSFVRYVSKTRKPERMHRSDIVYVEGTKGYIRYPVLVWCGKLYRGIEVIFYNSPYRTHTFWTEEAFNEWLEANNLEAKQRSYFSSMSENLFSSIVPPEFERQLIENRIVVAWLIPQNNWIVNKAGLGDIGFTKVQNAQEAAQDVLAWVGSRMLEPDPASITIKDDKIKLAKHGMDHTSFRKAPGKRNKR